MGKPLGLCGESSEKMSDFLGSFWPKPLRMGQLLLGETQRKAGAQHFQMEIRYHQRVIAEEKGPGNAGNPALPMSITMV